MFLLLHLPCLQSVSIWCLPTASSDCIAGVILATSDSAGLKVGADLITSTRICLTHCTPLYPRCIPTSTSILHDIAHHSHIREKQDHLLADRCAIVCSHFSI